VAQGAESRPVSGGRAITDRPKASIEVGDAFAGNTFMAMARRHWLVGVVSALALILPACSGDDTGPAVEEGAELGGPEAAGSDPSGTGEGAAPVTVAPSTPAGASPGRPAAPAPSPTVTTASGLAALPSTGPTAPTVPAPPTTTGLPPGTVETALGRSTLRFADPPGTTAEERSLVDTYHRFLRGLLGSTDPPNPDNEDLAATMSPDYLAKERERLELMRANAQLAFGNYESNPRVVRPLAGDVARIEDCALDSGVRFSTNGDILRPAATAFGRTVAELDRSSGAWRVRSWDGTGQACSP
jgi:hypothetical protein